MILARLVAVARPRRRFRGRRSGDRGRSPEVMNLKVDVLAKVKDAASPGAILASNTSAACRSPRSGPARRRQGADRRPPLLQPAAGDGARRGRPWPRHQRRDRRRLPRLRQAHRQDDDRRQRRAGLRDWPPRRRARRRSDPDRPKPASRPWPTSIAPWSSATATPMGPLKLTDLVGLDVRLAILEHLHKEVGEQFRPPSPAPADGARRPPRQARAARASRSGRPKVRSRPSADPAYLFWVSFFAFSAACASFSFWRAMIRSLTLP